MNIETVNELIQSLESAGELSIKEREYLELAKEFRICSTSLDAVIRTGNALADQNAQLAAENVALKQIIDSVTNLDNEPQYHDEGMGCGLEDRGITDRYDACRYGWDEAMERIYGEVIPCADELDFSATDAYLAGIKADGVEEFIGRLQQCVDEGDFVGDEVAVIVGAIDCGKEFFEQLREGADK
ncbi:hypothetical protein ACEVQM_005042 [Klebsiella pneumoniae]